MLRDDNDFQQYPGVIALDLTFILRRSSTAVNPSLTIIFVGSDKESYRQNEQTCLNLKAVASTLCLRSITGTDPVWELGNTFAHGTLLRVQYQIPREFLQINGFHNLFTTDYENNLSLKSIGARCNDILIWMTSINNMEIKLSYCSIFL